MSDIKLSGPLDENVQLPKVDSPFADRLNIDLKDLAHINSVGCRNWMNWIKTVKAKEGVFLHNCPPHFISQVSILFGFIPEGVTIQSFFVPYYCDACGAEEMLKIEAGSIDFANFKIEDEIICPICSALMHIDVVKDKFLAFWKKKSA